MFDVTVNRAHEVTLVRFHGDILPRHFAELDIAATVATGAAVPTDCILDFSDAESIDVPVRVLAERWGWPHVCADRRRFLVVNQPDVGTMARLLASYQAVAGCELPVVSASLEDALERLHCPYSGFQPVATTWLRTSISTQQSPYLH